MASRRTAAGRVGGSPLVIAAIALGVLASSAFYEASAFAQSSAELAAGRQLFAEALNDEEQRRFAAALAKYKRVQELRDTASVRFRIASSLEGLGKIAQAREAYAGAVTLGAANGKDADIVKAARARVDALGPRVGHLAVRVSTSSFTNAAVTVDNEPIAPASFADITVDPGSHVIAATANGARPVRIQVSVSEGERAEIPITLESASEPAPPTPVSPPPPPSAGPPLKTIGIVAGAAGVAFVVGGIVVLALRSSAISELERSCQGGNCPAEREKELTDTRDRAVLQGPIGVALIVTGAAAVGTGLTLFALSSSEKKSALRVLPLPTNSGAMLTIAKGF